MWYIKYPAGDTILFTVNLVPGSITSPWSDQLADLKAWIFLFTVTWRSISNKYDENVPASFAVISSSCASESIRAASAFSCASNILAFSSASFCFFISSVVSTAVVFVSPKLT